MPNTQPTSERAALRVASADAAHLPRRAAAMAALYLPMLHLPNTWASELRRVLDARSAGESCRPLDELLVAYGRPGAWHPRTYRDSDAADLRYWLDGLQERANPHLPANP